MFSFHSEQVHLDRSKGQGQRNIVHIENGKGYKEHATLSPSGKTRKRTRHFLKPTEVEAIRNRKFIPALFRCCRKTMRNKRRVQ
jgi:hypothetical protein